ncbi:MAG: Gfo/Idh/MocA family oxidoreductase [Verrucomicrobiaceae bacterium]
MTSRRHFISASTAALAASSFHIFGADPAKKYRTALIGPGWWGMNILREAIASQRVKVCALCDVSEDIASNAADAVNGLNGDDPKLYKDYRELLAKEKPEIVIIATPDHWHALQSIAACEAGAHVYVEKPTGHTIGESQAMVKAARKASVVVQVGLHRRIGPHHVEAMNFLKSGAVGKVGMVRAFAISKGGPEQPKPNSQIPEGMDWDLWCGPAPMRPFNTKLHPGGWRNFLDYANGTMGDWGVHWLDQILWWSGEKGPKKVFCTGGRPVAGPAVLNDQEQTTDAPDHQVATFEFTDFTAVWEHRKFAGNSAEKSQVGCYFYGDKGTLHIGWRDGWTFYPVDPKSGEKHGNHQLQEPDGHNIALLWADFIDAIEKKRPPVADIEAAHRSSCLPMLGMISHKAGRSIQWDAEKEQIIGDAEATKLMRREYRGEWKYPIA